MTKACSQSLFGLMSNEHEKWMREALAEAERGFELGEVPVGAVIVRDGSIIARGHNRREIDKDPTAHAEIVAIRKAAENTGDWRLTGATIYVTLEPCAMCIGAIIESRIGRLVYAAADPRMGCTVSRANIPEDLSHISPLLVLSGIMSEESLEILARFFKSLRP